MNEEFGCETACTTLPRRPLGFLAAMFSHCSRKTIISRATLGSETFGQKVFWTRVCVRVMARGNNRERISSASGRKHLESDIRLWGFPAASSITFNLSLIVQLPYEFISCQHTETQTGDKLWKWFQSLILLSFQGNIPDSIDLWHYTETLHKVWQPWQNALHTFRMKVCVHFYDTAHTRFKRSSTPTTPFSEHEHESGIFLWNFR